MPDLHAWIGQQIDQTQRIAETARGQGEGRWHYETGYHSGRVTDERGETVVYDEGAPLEEEAAHIAFHDPATVLRRCAADRKILAVHAPRDRKWYDDYVCEGCGYDGADYCSEPNVSHVNDCPTLLALAEGYGLTEGQRTALDRPEKEQPAPTGPSLVPNAIAEAYSKALMEMVMNARTVEPRLMVKLVGPAPVPMPEWLREDLGLPAPAPESTPEVKAMEILEPELKKISGCVPTTEEQQ